MIRWQEHPVAHIHAWLLLGVLVTGLLITSLTRHWMAAMPFHDHLVLGPLTGDWIHHSHGEATRQPRQALRWQLGATPEQTGAQVVSLVSGNAVQSFALSSFLLQSLVTTLLAFQPAADRRRLHHSTLACPRSILTTPPVPPPRSA